jgi:hypothetical protein
MLAIERHSVRGGNASWRNSASDSVDRPHAGPRHSGRPVTPVLARDHRNHAPRRIDSGASMKYQQYLSTAAAGAALVVALVMGPARAANDRHVAEKAHLGIPARPLDWLEQKVVAGDGVANQGFGRAAMIVGDTAFVGAPKSPTGAVYVFTRSAGAWTQTQELTPTDSPAGADFGSAVAFDDTTAIIGAPFTTLTDDGNRHQGAAIVFSKIDGVWTQTQQLIADDFAAENQFGNAVALAGDTILIGAYNAQIGGNAYQGAAYVFTRSGGTWTQAQKLTASEGAGGDDFGAAIAMSGSTAIIGSPYAAGANAQQGAAYVFTASGGTWSELQKLVASDGATLDDFGASLALDGDTALIGAQYAGGPNPYQGAAYVFTAAGGTWTQAARLAASDGASSDAFGEAVALDGTTAVIGAPFAAIGDVMGQGAAYVFSGAGAGWSETGKLSADDGAEYDGFGYVVAAGGSAVLAGSPLATVDGNEGQGAAYFFGQPAADEIFSNGFESAAP